MSTKGLCSPHYRQQARGATLAPIKLQLPKGSTEHEKLDHYTEKTEYCWNWTGGLNQTGHGILKTNRNGIRTLVGPHRIAYEREYGKTPDGLKLDHKCRNPRCVRPSHLHAVTNKQNMENLRGARSDSRTGVRGVGIKASGKYFGHVGHNGKINYVGTFETIEEAERAVIAKRNELFTNNRLDRGL